jgi:hypothetical protein
MKIFALISNERSFMEMLSATADTSENAAARRDSAIVPLMETIKSQTTRDKAGVTIARTDMT